MIEELARIQPAGWTMIASLVVLFILSQKLGVWYPRIAGAIVIFVIYASWWSATSEGTIPLRDQPMYLAGLIINSLTFVSFMFPRWQIRIPVISSIPLVLRPIIVILIVAVLLQANTMMRKTNVSLIPVTTAISSAIQKPSPSAAAPSTSAVKAPRQTPAPTQTKTPVRYTLPPRPKGR